MDQEDNAIPVLSLHQPWANLVALGVKNIETRSWKTSYRGPLTIHASARKARFEDMKRLVGDNLSAWNAGHEAGLVSPFSRTTDHMPYGAVVATCRLVRCVLIVTANPEQPIPDWACIDPGPAFGLRWTEPTNSLGVGWRIHHCEDQRPFGDFTPGRYAWLLSDIEPLDKPVPFKGGQGLTKRWKP